MEKANDKRELWIDFVKILATFLVVVLHTMNYGINNHFRNFGLLFYYCGTIAIPLFFMVNGYLQLSRKVDYSYVFSKIKKILFIVLIWNILPFVMNLILKNSENNLFSLAWNSMLQKGYFFQFWFLGSLIIMYLILPFLSKLFTNHFTMSYLLCGVLIIFSICIDIYNIRNHFLGSPVIKDTVIQTFRLWTWMTYFCIGGIIHRGKDNHRFLNLSKKLHFIIMTLSVLLSVTYEYFLSFQLYGNSYAENFYDSFLILITTVFAFTYLKRVDFSKWKKKITTVGPLTMGIYIIHPTFIKIVRHAFSISNNFINFLTLIIVLFTSVVFSYVLYKIPKLCNLIKL